MLLAHRRHQHSDGDTNMTEKLRVVLAGCGGMSRHWMEVARSMSEIDMVGFMDVIEENARKRASEFPESTPVIGTDLRTVLDATQPDIVFDCAIPSAHAPITLTALEHGCHVLSEKPLADSMENARTMVAAAEQAGKLFAVIQNRRYAPQHPPPEPLFWSPARSARSRPVDSDFYIGAHFGGFRDRMEHVLLLDMAIHTFDAARLIAGADPVVRLLQRVEPGRLLVRSRRLGGRRLRDGQWHRLHLPRQLVRRGHEHHLGVRLARDRAKGQRHLGRGRGLSGPGRAQTGGFRSEYDDVEVPPLDPGGQGRRPRRADRRFCATVSAEGRTPETIASDNIKSLAMVFGAIESSQHRKWVVISD